MKSTAKAQRIRDFAQSVGFELVGIAPAHPAPDFDLFRQWLDQGYAATMTYLHRGAEKRGDPSKILPGVRSVLCCGLNYYTGDRSSPISNYAWGEDYHRVVGEKLEQVAAFIRMEIDPTAQTRAYVDTGPVLERSYAASAGLGWIGKNTMLINNGVGSYFFIGEILTTLAFDSADYGRPALDQCGTCTQCLDACPTNAFAEPGVLDANRCISYLTIEYRREFSAEQENKVGGHLYGCDICQQVCPYNDRIAATPLAEFQPRPDLPDPSVRDEAEFLRRIEGSAMNRIKFSQWKRNLKALAPNEDSG